MSRTRKLSLISTAFALGFVLVAGVSVNGQQSIVNTTKSNVKDHRVAPPSESGSAKGWDGKVQGRALVTPVTVSFDDARDYENFVAGRLKINLIAKNTVSGQTFTLDVRELALSHRYKFGRDNRLVLNVIADNMSAPLNEAACGTIIPSAEKTGDGVNITLSYGACGSGPAQSAGEPVTGVIVKGGKNPGGNMNIVLGDSRVTTSDAAAEMSRAAGVFPGPLSKGAGSPKANGF